MNAIDYSDSELDERIRDHELATRRTSNMKIASVRNPAGGTIHFTWQPSFGSFLACSIEGTHYVFIYSRTGNILHKIPLKGNCTGLAWDEDGDILAIMTEASSVIILWDSHSQRLTEIESNIKDPGTCLAWSKTSKILAYTTSKGNLLIYNHQTLRKIPIIGKHTKRIVSAAWSNDNMLALATVDNQLSINTIDGDAIKSVSLRSKPSDLKFGHIKEDFVNSSVDNTVSLIVGEKTLYLLKVEDGITNPLELGFQPRYGNIVTHHWHGDGYILCAFSGGFIVMISSHHAEIGSELVLTELKGEPLRSAALCERLGQYAVAFADNLVEIRSASDPNKLITIVNMFEAEERIRPPIKCSWSFDGQLLAVVTSGGDLHMLLTTVPLLGASWGPYIVQMSSLHEITLHQFTAAARGFSPERTIRLDIEPTILAISPYHLAAALNNRVYFYTIFDVIANLGREPSFIREYNSNVQGITMNTEFVAVRTADKLHLQPLDEDNCDREPLTFPDAMTKRDAKIVAHCLTDEFLMYGHDNMVFKMFSLQRYTQIKMMPMNMSAPIKKLYADYTGTYALIVDRNGLCVFMDIASCQFQRLLAFPSRHDGVLWDTQPGVANMFVVYYSDTTYVSLYVVRSETLYGQKVIPKLLGNVDVFPQAGGLPLVLRNGKIYYQTAVGDIQTTKFIYTNDHSTRPDENPTHALIAEGTISNYGQNVEQEGHLHRIPENVLRLDELTKFDRWDDAVRYCEEQKDSYLWEKLGWEAMRAMLLKYAITAFSKIGDFGMVRDLKKIDTFRDDFTVCCGHVATMMGDIDFAEKCFKRSVNPISALYLRMSMHQWEEAEDLAREFAGEYICEVSAHHAFHQECLGNNFQALELYEQALQHAHEYPSEKVTQIVSLCEAGVARMSIKCGTPQKGIQIALNSRNPKLLKECAELLEKQKLYSEGANLYEECKDWNKATSLYLRAKNWAKVEALISRVTLPTVFTHYAKAKEAEGKYLEAAEAFEKARDVEGACRNYTRLNRPDDAIRLVMKFKSFGGALVTARYFENRQDFDTAIRFMILSNCHDDALAMAFKYGKPELYVSIVQDIVNNKEYGRGDGILLPEYKEGVKRVGQYFEEQKDNVKAGKYYHISGQYRKAFIILMKSASSGVAYDEENLLNLLTEATAACKDDHFEKQYVEFCLGEKDGNPKDPSHLLTYYLKVRKYNEATRTALIMSSDYLQNGSYKLAHRAVFNAVREIRDRGIHVKKDLMEEFTTVHYYVLAIKQGAIQNFAVAARLYVRLLDNLSRFPRHATNIMAQAVIFCQKAGLQETAMKTCFDLMKPENRSKIPPQYKSKFETMVRKSGKSKLTDEEDGLSPCPSCTNKTRNYELCCPHCRSDIPFCIASGRHIVATDLTACPHCNFPAIRREMQILMKDAAEQVCPLCEEPVSLSEWIEIADIGRYVQQSTNYQSSSDEHVYSF